MDNIINKIVTNPVNITWVGIGSAVIRNTNPENMQQLPPFIENLYNNSNVSMRLINFDPEFEKPYFLTTYYNNLSHDESTSDIDIYTINNNRLEIIYINHPYNIDFLDQINKIIMEQENLLICGIFTGELNDILETHFQKLYQDTPYKELYDKYIIYNFISNEGGCYCNLLTNFPIIEGNQIIKLNSIKPELIYTKYIEISGNALAISKFKQIIINEFKEYININHFVFRNLIKNNINNSVIYSLQFSIFNNIENISDIENLCIVFKNFLIIYYNIFEKIFMCSNDNLIIFNDLINTVNTDDIYGWYNKIIKIINVYFIVQ